jgi:hypothetical protein
VDCNHNSAVAVDELITMVNVALSTTPASGCLAGDSNQDGAIKVNEIILAVNNTLSGCPVPPTPTPTRTPTAHLQSEWAVFGQ